jgi:hypothetical protein
MKPNYGIRFHQVPASTLVCLIKKRPGLEANRILSFGLTKVPVSSYQPTVSTAPTMNERRFGIALHEAGW